MLRERIAVIVMFVVWGCGSSPTESKAPPAPPMAGATGTNTAASVGSGGAGASAPNGSAGKSGSTPTTSATAGTTSKPAAGGGGSGASPSTAAGSGTSSTSAGSAGDANAGGASGSEGTAGSGMAMGMAEPKIPDPPEPCPMLQTGTVTIQGTQVQLWVGNKQEGKHGPVLIYWHFTGGNSSEALTWSTAMSEIMAEGGIIASGNQSTGKGDNTGNGVWYTEDFKIADEVVACAKQQLDIDPRRIYTAGGSAGALQAGIMVYKRSSYLAASVPNSGGYTIGGNELEDPSHVPPVMTLHGAMGVDVVIVDFSVQSLVLDVDVAKKGGFAVDCNHGGGHVGAPANLIDAGWQFMKDHPFGVSPEPYANGLPMSFPTYCKIIKSTDTAPDGCCKGIGMNGGAGSGAGGSSP